MKNRFVFLLTILCWLANLPAVSQSRIDSILAGQKTAPAATPASTVPKNFTGGQDWFYIIFKLVFFLVIISVIIYMLVWFLKKLQFRRGFGGTLPPELYKVIGMAPMSYNKQFMLVKFYDAVYVLAFSENSLACLDKIDDPEKIADIESLVPVMSNLPDKFAKVLKKKMKQVEKGGAL